jgi:hypothetical protein
VQQALGHAPRDFAYYARDAAATGIWDGPQYSSEPVSLNTRLGECRKA